MYNTQQQQQRTTPVLIALILSCLYSSSKFSCSPILTAEAAIPEAMETTSTTGFTPHHKQERSGRAWKIGWSNVRETPCEKLQCPHGACGFRDCEQPVSCKGGGCLFENCYSPTCQGGGCKFISCYEEEGGGGGGGGGGEEDMQQKRRVSSSRKQQKWCTGGGCDFMHHQSLLIHSFCDGGGCTIEGYDVESDARTTPVCE